METIGERAARLIKERVRYGKVKPELDRIGVDTYAFYGWDEGRYNPSAYYLQQMALAGYDVIYILTGKENKKC